MAEYKRLVSYIYSYEHGKKNNNAGFAKVDLRNGMCKVTISFKIQHMPIIHPLKVYFFKRETNYLIGVPIGIGKITGMSYEFKEIINSDNISGSGYNLDKMSGVYIYDGINKNTIYASEWDDKPVITNQFIVYNEYIISEEQRNAEIRQRNSTQSMQVDTSVIDIINDFINENNKKDECKNEQIEFVDANNKQNDHEYENISMEINNSGKENIWDSLYSKYTKIIGIKNNTDIECIKIKPQDLACLPNKYWVLGNNSFLLHGYYNYRYLLFAKVNENKYKLGVPGIFHRNEKMMASMFGFEEFLEADQNNMNENVFGYWCMDIQI